MLNVFWFAFIGEKSEFVLVHASVDVFGSVRRRGSAGGGGGVCWRGGFTCYVWECVEVPSAGGCSHVEELHLLCVWECVAVLSAGRCFHVEGLRLLCVWECVAVLSASGCSHIEGLHLLCVC